MFFFFFQAEDGIRDGHVTGVQTCALPISLSEIDRFYTDPAQSGTPVADQLVRQLSAPRPKDSRVTRHLADYKALNSAWHDWSAVVAACQTIARRIVEEDWQ